MSSAQVQHFITAVHHYRIYSHQSPRPGKYHHVRNTSNTSTISLVAIILRSVTNPNSLHSTTYHPLFIVATIQMIYTIIICKRSDEEGKVVAVIPHHSVPIIIDMIGQACYFIRTTFGSSVAIYTICLFLLTTSPTSLTGHSLLSKGVKY